MHGARRNSRLENRCDALYTCDRGIYTGYVGLGRGSIHGLAEENVIHDAVTRVYR